MMRRTEGPFQLRTIVGFNFVSSMNAVFTPGAKGVDPKQHETPAGCSNH